VFRTPAGERVLRDLMGKCSIWDTTFDENALAMANNEGRRTVILGIMEMVKKNMELPTTYADEATQRDMDYKEEQVHEA